MTASSKLTQVLTSSDQKHCSPVAKGTNEANYPRPERQQVCRRS